jgi:IMP dehydrogenase/GMP reductase
MERCEWSTMERQAKPPMKNTMVGLPDYRASEGRTVEVPYRGPVVHTVQEILGGLRSACAMWALVACLSWVLVVH